MGTLIFAGLNYKLTIRYFDTQDECSQVSQQNLEKEQTESQKQKLGLFQKKDNKTDLKGSTKQQKSEIDITDQTMKKHPKNSPCPGKTIEIWRKNIIYILSLWNDRIYNQMGFEWRLGELPKHLRTPNTNYIDYVELRFNPGKSRIKIDKLPKVKKRKYPF